MAESEEQLKSLWIKVKEQSEKADLKQSWEIMKDREALDPAVLGVAKSQTGVSNWTTAIYFTECCDPKLPKTWHPCHSLASSFPFPQVPSPPSVIYLKSCWEECISQCFFSLLSISNLNPWVGKIPWRRAWQSPSVFFPAESPWMEEPGGLQGMGSQRAGHDWETKHSTAHHLLTSIEKFKRKIS